MTIKTNISGTITKDARPNSGLDEVGEKMLANQMQRYVVVGVIEYHGDHNTRGQGRSVTVSFPAIEPILDGKDEATVRKCLDRARAARGLAGVELTLFDINQDNPKGPWPGDLDYVAPQDGPGRTPAERNTEGTETQPE